MSKMIDDGGRDDLVFDTTVILQRPNLYNTSEEE